MISSFWGYFKWANVKTLCDLVLYLHDLTGPNLFITSARQ